MTDSTTSNSTPKVQRSSSGDLEVVIGDETYNGQLLTGTLADGSSISAEIFNGVSGSQIVLAAAPVPLPAAGWLFLGAVASLFGFGRAKRGT